MQLAALPVVCDYHPSWGLNTHYDPPGLAGAAAAAHYDPTPAGAATAAASALHTGLCCFHAAR